jgi:hypothetical protein
MHEMPLLKVEAEKEVLHEESQRDSGRISRFDKQC